MTEEPEESELPSEGKRVAVPTPIAEEAEKPLFDLGELMRARKRGEISILDYAILTDIQERREERREEKAWRREQKETMPKQNTPSPDVEALKNQVSELTETVNNLIESLRSQQQEKAQKEFVEGVVKQTTDKIMPDLQAVKQKLEEYDEKLAKGGTPEFSLEEFNKNITEAIDRIGEKVGAGGKTLTDVVNDVDKIMTLVDSITKRIKTGEGGEVDYKTMAVSTVGEIGKELISAYRDIATSGAGPSGFETPKEETPASTMQTIIKRQVQNYLTNRMQAGAVTFNVAEAAKELGLTPGQIVWAYKALMKEGFFQVKVPTKTKRKVRETETIGEETETPTPPETTEEQVFNPPAET